MIRIGGAHGIGDGDRARGNFWTRRGEARDGQRLGQNAEIGEAGLEAEHIDLERQLDEVLEPVLRRQAVQPRDLVEIGRKITLGAEGNFEQRAVRRFHAGRPGQRGQQQSQFGKSDLVGVVPDGRGSERRRPFLNAYDPRGGQRGTEGADPGVNVRRDLRGEMNRRGGVAKGKDARRERFFGFGAAVRQIFAILPLLFCRNLWRIGKSRATIGSEKAGTDVKSFLEKFSPRATGHRSGSWSESWAATARQALLYALPLGFVALLAAQWLDADYLALRENSRRREKAAAETMGVTAAGEVSTLAAFARANVDRAAAEGLDPPNALWRVISGYDQQLLVLIRAGDHTLFPPEDPLAAPKMWEEKLRTLIGVASLLRDGDFVNGWFPDAAGEYYFECLRVGAEQTRKESCIALNARFIFPEVIAALTKRAEKFPGWAFRLRDPFGLTIWQVGVAPEGYESFLMNGALRGWAVDIVGPRASGHSVFERLALAAPLAMVWLLLVYQARRADKARLSEAAARAALATRLSHDLRTPLANLKLYAELISRKAGDVAGLDRYCAVLTEEIDRLDALAGETIFGDRSAAQAPKLVAADPCDLARRVVARYERLLSASNCQCETHCAAAGLLRFDASAFERILINLLDNARKYAPGRIDVEVSWRDGLLMIEVRDHGAAGAGGGEAKPSHGLGLSIVQDLARANGGSFSLSGADPGLRARAAIRALAEGEPG